MKVFSHLVGSFDVLLANATADRSHMDMLWCADVSSPSLERLAGALVAGHLGHLVRRTNTFYQG